MTASFSPSPKAHLLNHREQFHILHFLFLLHILPFLVLFPLPLRTKRGPTTLVALKIALLLVDWNHISPTTPLAIIPCASPSLRRVPPFSYRRWFSCVMQRQGDKKRRGHFEKSCSLPFVKHNTKQSHGTGPAEWPRWGTPTFACQCTPESILHTDQRSSHPPRGARRGSCLLGGRNTRTSQL